ncbi:ATP-binding protein [Albirhodobacter sp. R86504]|uniref:ATP-binding protein n=1 Tax=Albirhodobacter sp. R86504 TaxID=3093848 RepID=UPI00366C9EF6
MNEKTFQMPQCIDDVDDMVLALKAEAAGYLAGEALFRLELTVSEALSNLVIHGTSSKAPIDIRLKAQAGAVQIEIFDPDGASPFDITAHAKALETVELLAENGRGLGLIIACSDGVTYGAVGGRQRLQISFAARP